MWPPNCGVSHLDTASHHESHSHPSDQNFQASVRVTDIPAATDVGVPLSLRLLTLCSSFSFLFLPFILFLTFKRVVKRCFTFCLYIPGKFFLMKLSTLLWNWLILVFFCDSQVSVYTLDLPNVCPTAYFCFSDVFIIFANVQVTNYQHNVNSLCFLNSLHLLGIIKNA